MTAGIAVEVTHSLQAVGGRISLQIILLVQIVSLEHLWHPVQAEVCGRPPAEALWCVSLELGQGEKERLRTR